MKYTERIYSDSEIKLIEEIFDMYIKQIYDEDLGKLVLECKDMFLDSQRLMKENKRLNNIIKEAREKIEGVRIYSLRSGKTIIGTLLNDILEILEGVNK